MMKVARASVSPVHLPARASQRRSTPWRCVTNGCIVIAALSVALAAVAGCSSAAEGGGTATDLPSFENPLNPVPTGTPGDGTTAGTQAQCQPAATRCIGARTLETCNAQGTGFIASTCGSEMVCLAGGCRPLSCVAGSALCLGPELHTCNADGKSTTVTQTCAAGQGCRSTTLSCEPYLCDPLLGACNGNVATRCDVTGFAFDSTLSTDCGNQLCMAGACRSPELPNNPNNPDTPLDPINPDPGNNDPTNPPVGAASCTANEVVCEGANTIGTCRADGSGFDITRCPDGTVCEGAGNCAPVACNAQNMPSFNGGQATVYWFAQGTVNFGNIACGYGITAGNPGNGDGDAVTGIANPNFFVAINTTNYRGSGSCGACVEMSYQGRNVVATVVDECPIASNPTCTAGHLDLSRGAWNALTNNLGGTEISGVNWRFVPCPGTGGVTVELKEPNNQYWNEFLVRNHRYPIARAEVQMDNGTWVEAARSNYNYFQPPDGIMGTYRVRLTDINGGVVEEQLELAPGAQGGNAQFQCQ